PAHQDIWHQQVSLVIRESRPVDAKRVEPGRASDRDRGGGVPFVEPAPVHVRIDLAADHGRHLSSRRPQGYQFSTKKTGNIPNEAGWPAPAHHDAQRGESSGGPIVRIQRGEYLALGRKGDGAGRQVACVTGVTSFPESDMDGPVGTARLAEL